MKPLVTILSLLNILFIGVWSVSSAPLLAPSLSITAHPPMVKSKQDVRVDITIINTSNAPMPVAVVNGKGNAEFCYDISVTRQDGQPVERTNYGHSLVGEGTAVLDFSKQLIRLSSGQSYADYFLLNRIYDVSKPGVYVVQLQQKPAPAGAGIAQSNSIQVIVQ